MLAHKVKLLAGLHVHVQKLSRGFHSEEALLHKTLERIIRSHGSKPSIRLTAAFAGKARAIAGVIPL